MSFREVSLVVYELAEFGWKELLAQGVLILAIVVAWAANLLDTNTASKIIAGIIGISNLGGAYKVYKVSKKSVRPRA
jgi:hypothetical protein